MPMKRFVVFLSAVLLACSIGGCSDNSTVMPEPDPEPTPDPGKDMPVGDGVAIPIQFLVEQGSLINSYIDPTGLEVSLSNQGKNIEVRCYGDNFYYSRNLGREWSWWNQTPIGDNPFGGVLCEVRCFGFGEWRYRVPWCGLCFPVSLWNG